MDTKFSVFISHVSEDEAIAVMLKNSIERVFLNSEVFVSGRDLKGGEIWVNEIKEKLRKSSIIIALVTEFSCNSNWVLFEAGSGFIENKSIPLCVEPITISKLTPPLSLLQARNYNEEGIKKLLQDISRITELRIPHKIPGISEEINEVKEYLSIRSKSNDEKQYKQSAKKSVARIKDFVDEHKEDLEIKTKIMEVEKRVRDFIISQLSLVDSTTYEIPPQKELKLMSLDDLGGLGKYANIPFNYFIVTQLKIEKMVKHTENEPKWKRINTLKGIESINKDVSKYVKN